MKSSCEQIDNVEVVEELLNSALWNSNSLELDWINATVFIPTDSSWKTAQLCFCMGYDQTKRSAVNSRQSHSAELRLHFFFRFLQISGRTVTRIKLN